MKPTRANSARLVTPLPVHQMVRLMGEWGLGDGALHTQLASHLRMLVVSGKLAAGVRLPSERALAEALDVSRNTVGAAFDELRGDGILTSRRGDGTYVSSARQFLGVRGDDRFESFLAPATGAGHRIDLRSAALPGLSLVVDAASVVGPELAPLVESHGYLPEGLPALRVEVAGYYSSIGLPTTPDQILITSGAQQAMRMAAVSMLEPGSVALVEEPSFRGVIEVLRAAGARLEPVRRGPYGIETSELVAAVRRSRPRLLVMQSTVHNPTGTVINPGWRRQLAITAESLGLTVLDDTTLADAMIDGPPATPMAAWGSSVITVGSVSKSFWGGLRVGWLRADPGTVASLASMKAGEDLGTSLLAQVTTARLLPRIEEARAERRRVLGAARDVVLTALAECLPECEPVEPVGGASLWVRLPAPVATSLVQRAERLGVQLLPGTTFSCVDAFDDHLRIGFAAGHDQLRAGVRMLTEAWRIVGKRA
ncbi:GntR family transcriptional regulator [Kribbella sp. VKM Ac-2569]|uniref:aminotransferase-like domain-containing protein n=1 Tax=Kribbella sp. VKM Ac-2569 TaxID=2512220 RepID=UPI00102BBFE2|nr:PLP-dependent aminotransferase family protein [Kribbella sp. VKM Ac-2569]RZT07576.1 GntR family transcriptional regulator [Kribbella sp. VKM Ac-2569]